MGRRAGQQNRRNTMESTKGHGGPRERMFQIKIRRQNTLAGQGEMGSGREDGRGGAPAEKGMLYARCAEDKNVAGCKVAAQHCSVASLTTWASVNSAAWHVEQRQRVQARVDEMYGKKKELQSWLR